MLSYRMARRSFLRGLGASSILYPLLRSIEAAAQGSPPPPRFFVLHHPLGCVYKSWLPTGTTTTDFTLSDPLSPFAPLQSKMVVIDGLNLVASSMVAGTAGNKTHEGGVVALMTGVPELRKLGQEDHVAGGASIDQLFLAQSPKLKTLCGFNSLALGVDNRSDRNELAPRVMSYGPVLNNDRNPILPERQPLTTYNRIFGQGALPNATVAQLTRIRAQKQSIVDYMRSDLDRLRTLIPASETVKLDAHAASIMQLESTLDATYGSSSSLCPKCTKPVVPVEYSDNPEYFYPAQPDFHPHGDLGRAQLALIKAAFACDLVRVATFMWSPGTNHVLFYGYTNAAGGTVSSSQHHPVSHTLDTGVVSWLNGIDKWYAEQTSLAIQDFDKTPDIAGAGSLLDNTVIAYVSEVGRAYDHDFTNVPTTLFGGGNLGIQGGRLLRIADGPLPSTPNAKSTGNRPMNDLWLSLAPAFGVTMQTLGDKSQYTGPIPNLVTTTT